MDYSFIEKLPPNMQFVPVVTAVVMAVLGVILWAAGLKVAKAYLAIYTGLLLAIVGVGFFASTQVAGLMAMGGFIGLVVGIVAGVLAFRVVQALMLAACLSLIVGGSYCYWQLVAYPAISQSETLHDQVVRMQSGREQPVAKPALNAAAAIFTTPVRSPAELKDRFIAIPSDLRQRTILVTAAVFVAVTIVSLLLVKQVTWVVSAWVGSTMVVAGIQVWLHLYQRQFEHVLEPGTPASLITMISMLLAGMAIQRVAFWPMGWQKESEKDESQPEVALV